MRFDAAKLHKTLYSLYCARKSVKHTPNRAAVSNVWRNSFIRACIFSCNRCLYVFMCPPMPLLIRSPNRRKQALTLDPSYSFAGLKVAASQHPLAAMLGLVPGLRTGEQV